MWHQVSINLLAERSVLSQAGLLLPLFFFFFFTFMLGKKFSCMNNNDRAGGVGKNWKNLLDVLTVDQPTGIWDVIVPTASVQPSSGLVFFLYMIRWFLLLQWWKVWKEASPEFCTLKSDSVFPVCRIWLHESRLMLPYTLTYVYKCLYLPILTILQYTTVQYNTYKYKYTIQYNNIQPFFYNKSKHV